MAGKHSVEVVILRGWCFGRALCQAVVNGGQRAVR